MSYSIQQITDDVIAAMKGVLMGAWPSVAVLARGEAVKLAQTAATIAEIEITADTTSTASQRDVLVAALLDMQKHATRAVLLSAEGIGLLVAEQAVNAAVAVVTAAVNKAVGVQLL